MITGDSNEHVRSDMIGYKEVHWGHGVGALNEVGIKVIHFATAYQMRILKYIIPKDKEQLGNIYSSGGR